jgi:pimeloyl-ACP methyl ester carboxylesterase
MTTVAVARTGRLDVPGARLYYELRGGGPLVALVGAPMGADAFAPLADLLASDYTVLTADPRGIGRSRVHDPDADSLPQTRAADLARLIDNAGVGPAVVLGSSGGAVTGLALAQDHPGAVHTVVAHEPPLVELLQDRDALRVAEDEYCAAYLAGDVVGAWTRFFAQANIGIPPQVVEQMFGGERDPQQVADERFWFAHELRHSTRWQPDVALLRATGVRIVVGIGQDSADQICDRTSLALAGALQIEPAMFPGGHIGFVDDPKPFAARLRSVLAAAPSALS